MPSKNDITGDTIQSKSPSKAYEDNYDRIFGKKTAVDDAADVMSEYDHDHGDDCNCDNPENVIDLNDLRDPSWKRPPQPQDGEE